MAAKFVKENFYVDDGLISVPSSHLAIDLIDQTRDLCSKGGLILHKFVTNNDKLSQHLNISDSPEVKEELHLKNPPSKHLPIM